MRNYDRPVLQSAERTLRVVQLLGQRGSISLTEVAHELDVSPSIAHRLLATCCEVGFARQEAPGGTYEIGAALLELSLGATRATALRDAGAVTLSRACKELGETISVVVLEGRTVRFVETLEGERVVRVSTPLGKTFPTHATAGGRAMLACLSDADLQRRYPTRSLPRVSRSAVSTWRDLCDELARVRDRGWAMQLGEADAEISAVAYPVLDSLGQPRAALTVTVPRARLSTSREAARLARRLEPYARTIQRRLRGSH